MWSLPDIKRLNEQAASKAAHSEIRQQLSGRRKVECAICDKPATKDSRHEWFDIFSDDPKGVVGLCAEHDEECGPHPEGFFFCDGCNRLFINNYTWENYYHVTDEGEIFCLNCYAKRYVDDPDNWINLDEVDTDRDEDGNLYDYTPGIDELTFEQVRKAAHVIAVDGPTPKGIKYFDGVNLDAFSGGRVTGFSSSEDSPDGGVGELQDILRAAKAAGHTKALLVLDGAYQFCVSIGVYVPD